MNTPRILIAAALACSLASCASSTWHYQTNDDKTTTHGRAGQKLSIQSEGSTVQFEAPAGWKITDSFEEPQDWDYAANAPQDTREFGVRVEKDKPGSTAAGRYQDYLKNAHQLYDPKVRMNPETPFVLKDGRRITPYRFSSDYWKQRLVIIIPEDKAMTTFEFTAPTQESLKASRELIQQMLATYSRKS